MKHESLIPLYKKVLGNAWENLPEEIRRIHDVVTNTEAEGLATIECGHNPLATLARLIVGMPAPGTDVSIHVKFSVKDGVETWTRKFNGKPFYSLQYAGQGRLENLIIEQFGIMSFIIALELKNDRLNLNLRGWRFLGIPMPLWLGVRSDTYETVENERFVFNVKISHPLTGLIVHYRGWLLPKPFSGT